MQQEKTFITCDRCGKTFEDTAGQYKGHISMWMQFQSWNGIKVYDNGNKRYDLCIDCEREFIKWFSGR